MEVQNNEPKTGQTGQDEQEAIPAPREGPGEKEKAEETQRRTPFFEIALNETENKWYWCLWSGNGRKMAISAEGYERKKDCTAAIKSFRATMEKVKHIAQAQ